MSLLARRIRSIDWTLLLGTLPIVAAGYITMSSFRGQNYFSDRQGIWILVAILIFFLASFIDWRFLRRTYVVVIVYAGSLALLLALFLVGAVSHGAQSWFRVGLFAIQPADLVKLVLIITLAKYFSRRHIAIAHYRHIIVSGVYAFLLFGLVAAQPDFGSAVILFAIWLGMIVVSGIPIRHLAVVVGLGVASFCLLWFFAFAPYQKARVLTFLDPARDVRGSGYNVLQSMVAVGSGGATGKGVGYGTQSRLAFLPEYQTDFIFAAFSEEWGFVGALFLIIFYCIVLWRILSAALHGATNFETLFGVGLAVMLAAHIFVNIGMNIGILPVTGITLPFMSYGGSHLFTEFLGLGILMGMRRYARAAHAEDTTNEFLGPT